MPLSCMHTMLFGCIEKIEFLICYFYRFYFCVAVNYQREAVAKDVGKLVENMHQRQEHDKV